MFVLDLVNKRGSVSLKTKENQILLCVRYILPSKNTFMPQCFCLLVLLAQNTFPHLVYHFSGLSIYGALTCNFPDSPLTSDSKLNPPASILANTSMYFNCNI